MKFNLKYIILIFFTSVFFISCNESQITEDPMDPSSKPVASYSIENFVASTVESDEFTYVININLDRPLREDLPFKAYQVGGDANAEDYVISNATIAANTTSATITVKINNDMFPENDESLKIKVSPANSTNSTAWDAEHWGNLLSPSSPTEEFEVTIVNSFDDGLVVVTNWDTDMASDLDVFVFDSNGDGFSVVGTADVPEIANLIPTSSPDGTYTIGIDPYSVEPGATIIPTHWTFGSPDGVITNFDHDFDYENRFTNYSTNYYAPWGTDAFLLFEIIKTGNSFVVTAL